MWERHCFQVQSGEIVGRTTSSQPIRSWIHGDRTTSAGDVDGSTMWRTSHTYLRPHTTPPENAHPRAPSSGTINDVERQLFLAIVCVSALSI